MCIKYTISQSFLKNLNIFNALGRSFHHLAPLTTGSVECSGLKTFLNFYYSYRTRYEIVS